MSEFVEGAEVILQRSGWSRVSYGPVFKIGKVYKNGKFMLEGDEDKAQWKPSGSLGAKRTGDGSYSERLYVLTDQVRADAEKSKKVSEAIRFMRAESERLDKLSRGNDDDAILAAYETIKANG